MAFIDFHHVDLTYPIRHFSGVTLKEFLLGVLRGKKPPAPPGSEAPRAVDALKDVSFQFRDGERVGIIGNNGAGKSTLLRTIAGVYPIARGSRNVFGSVCGLFDITVGFEHEATGYENIFFRSYLQGDTPRGVQAKLQDIADFCELGNFLKLPLRCYSTGMITRLAFAVATASTAEILLIDEVFAAGDLSFQKKAEARLSDLMHQAKIVVMVGHNLVFMQEFSSRILWMDKGRLRADGPPSEIIPAYISQVQQQQEQRQAA